MEFLITLEQLKAAWGQVRLGTKSAGIDGITVDWFATLADRQLTKIQHQLHQENYNASPALGFYLPKKDGGFRLIGIPIVADRIIQRMLLEEMYFPLEDTFLDCSYAYRPGRNIQMAVQHLYSYYQFQPCWIIKADIMQFFDHLCWALLLTQLEQLQLETMLLQLLEQQLKSGIVVKGKRLNPGKGVLQGAVLSGALANLYLTEFDRRCLQAGLNLVRYGDDFAIACHSFIEANRILSQIIDWLGELYLKLKPEKTHIYSPDDEFIFLGYRFFQGKVYPPPPPETKAGEWVISDSGTPYFRRKVRPVKLISRPPKGCALVKPPLIKSSLAQYWQEQMTTLYVTDQGAYINVHHQQFQVFFQRELRIKVPVNRVSHIVLFGCCNLSHGAVSLALRRRIPIMYLSQKGRYFGRLETEGVAKVEYLSQQVICAQNSQFVRQNAEAIVRAKLHNSRVLLLRLNQRRKLAEVEKAIDSLSMLMESLPKADSMDALRGYEGKGANFHFQALGKLFNETFAFEKRTKRPPTDPVNSLLSLGYTLLSQNVNSFIQAVGLHTHFGNLHVPRDNHPALVSDLMEEFRALIVDSLVVYVVNSKIVTPENFTAPDFQGGVYLLPDTLKKFLKHWEEKLQTEVLHPNTGYKATYRRCLELQVREYIACLVGDVEVYRPMTWNK